MPLYEYECDRGHRFEKIQKFSDPPVEKCPECGAVVHKVQSAPAFHLKGTGWYVTDYAKKEAAAAKTEGDAKETKEGAATAEKAETPEKAATPDKSEKKSEKPEKSDKSKPDKSEKTAKPEKSAAS